MKDLFLIPNENSEMFEEHLRLNEFFNWDFECGNFRTVYKFENLTEEQLSFLTDLEKNLS